MMTNLFKSTCILSICALGIHLNAMNNIVHQQATSAATQQQTVFVKRTDFFKQVLGMEESEFRNTFDWKGGKLKRFPADALQWAQTSPDSRGDMPHSLKQWIAQYPARALLFQGTLSCAHLGLLTQKTSGAANSPVVQLAKPGLAVLFHDPANPQATDIRSLVAKKENENASFQVASTPFGMLEGGMFARSAYLGSMLKGAAQGEEISLCTAAATLARKYIGGYNPYLLERLPSLNYEFSGKHAFLSIDKVLSYQPKATDYQEIEIGTHENVVVSFGEAENCFKKPEAGDTQKALVTHVDVQTGLVNQASAQTINLIFTSAYSIRGLDDRLAQDPRTIAFCQMLLKSAYEGTLKAHYLCKTKQPKLFLTLMGASAFCNKIEWLAQAIDTNTNKEFIRQAGLDVTLIYRADANKPHRNALSDAQFLKDMLFMADEINNTRFCVDIVVRQMIDEYTQCLYQGTDQAMNRASSLAQRLNGLFNGNNSQSAASSAAAASAASAASAAKDYESVPRAGGHPFRQCAVEKYMDLKDGSALYWLFIQSYLDAVLVRYDERTKQMQFVSPDVPSVHLPQNLHYWKSQGAKPEIGNHKLRTAVSDTPKGKQFVYDHGTKNYVDSTHSKNVYDSEKSKVLWY